MIRRAAVLSPEKLKSYESPSQARGKTRSWRVARLGGPADRRSARVAEAEQPADLVERLAGGVVDGRAEQPIGQVVAHLGEERVAAGHDERDEREDRIGVGRASPGSRSHAA